MKKRLLSAAVVFFFTLLLAGCSSSVNNSITFNNMSDSELYVNFRGSIVDVLPGKIVVMKEIPKGTYDYATTYTIPASATSASVQGDVSGTVSIKAGTKILILYSSTLTGTSYLLSATMSNSDDQSTNSTNPTGP